MRTYLRLRRFSLAPLLLLLGCTALFGARVGGVGIGIDRDAERVLPPVEGSGHAPLSPGEEAPAFELELKLEEVEDDHSHPVSWLPALLLVGEVSPWARCSHALDEARWRSEARSLSHAARAPPA